MTPEGRVKQKIVKWLKTLPRTRFFTIQDRYTSGIPDIIGVHHGAFFAIEVKARSGKVSQLQKVTLAALAVCGGKVGVARSVKDVEKILEGE